MVLLKKKENLFYLIFILTIVLIRVGVFLIPNVDIVFWNVVIHHFWFGVVLLIAWLLIKENKIGIYSFGIGSGLMVDQLAFILLGSGGDFEYWGPSLLGAVVLAVLIYFFRRKIVKWLF
jgi:hypothetical protein